MSYEIETKKLCVTVPLPDRKDDDRFANYDPFSAMTLFCIESCSNNVHPRTPRWHVIEAAIVSVWDDRPMFPASIWMAARDADGGMIKPNNINCSGTAYIRQWQKAWAERVGWDASPFRPSQATVWEKQPYEVSGVPLHFDQLHIIPHTSERWGKYEHMRTKIHAAFHAINWQPYFGSTSRRADVTDRAAFLNALFLYTNRKDFPFTINLS